MKLGVKYPLKASVDTLFFCKEAAVTSLTAKVNRILAVSSSVKFYDALKTAECTQGKELFFASSLSEAKRFLLTDDADIVVFNCPLTDGFGLELAASIAADSTRGVMVFAKEDIFEQVNKKALPLGIFAVKKPTTVQIMDQSLKLLEASVHRISKVQEKADGLLHELEELKLISRAKLLLMQQFSMSENDAHRYIEKRAMNSGLTGKIIAENIIKSYQN